MNEIIDFVEGKLSFDEMESYLYLKPELWDWVQSLVPEDIADENCPFRKRHVNMPALETNNYQIKPTIMNFGFNGYLAHSWLSNLVVYNYPDVIVRDPPDDSLDGILIKMGLDYIQSPETEGFIRNLLAECSDKPLREKKKALKESFGIKPRKYPEWAQESEWPMGDGAPMHFVAQNQNGDYVEYVFADEKSGEQKIIKQLF